MGTEPDAKYVAAWRQMRGNARLTLLVVVLGFAAGFLLINLACAVAPGWVLGLTVGIPVYVGLLAARRRLESVPCPRCGQSFVGPAKARRGWGKRDPWLVAWRVPTHPVNCYRCGLPFGAPRDSASTAVRTGTGSADFVGRGFDPWYAATVLVRGRQPGIQTV